MAPKRKREGISLQTKYAIIQAVEEKQKYSEIMKKFGLKSKANISRIMEKKKEIKDAFEQNINCQRKTLKTSPFEEVEIKLKNFIFKCNEKAIPINGPLLKEKAKEIALKMDCKNFEANNGWMDRFCKRNHILLKEIY